MADEIDVTLMPDIEHLVSKLVIDSKAPLEVAKQIVTKAQASAPVDSGDYRKSIEAQKTQGGARVFAGDYKSVWIEFGVPSRHIAGTNNLRNAAAGLGLTFRKRGR